MLLGTYLPGTSAPVRHCAYHERMSESERLPDHSDAFACVLGSGRGSHRLDHTPDASHATTELLTRHLIACGWTHVTAKNGGSSMWIKDGHAHMNSSARWGTGYRMTLIEAVSEQLLAEDLFSAGWILRGGTWIHPNPPAHAPTDRDYTYEHAHLAHQCQVFFSSPEEKS